MKLLIIYNPQAGHKRAARTLKAIKSAFQAKAVQANFMYTEYAWHGVALVREADLSNYDGVIAAGGDGTLFEVINGYQQNKLKHKPPLGIIPIGTGNAFARDLNLKSYQWEKAIELIVKKRTRKADLARFTTEGQVYYYMNVLGFGFVSDANKTARSFKKLGNMAYSIGVFWQLLRMKTYPLEMELDGQFYKSQNFFVEIANTRYTGATFIIAPEAEIDDGYLDVILLNKASRFKIIRLFPTIFKGEHVHQSEVEVFKAKKISVLAPSSKILTPDGELMGKTPIDIECLHRAVEFFC
ncbi:MAG: hypothetical protein CSA81_08180 [Acidobacteria bacterium]|nr:MAG: hypothetical protein CSA81_08180 [Acidobacteriota bacterium]PIE89702.1 MAG: hypothetical protein CR997_09715 [Acidobacteriota bacterium]